MARYRQVTYRYCVYTATFFLHAKFKTVFAFCTRRLVLVVQTSMYQKDVAFQRHVPSAYVPVVRNCFVKTFMSVLKV